jgi:putative restriction endonuclease
MPEFNDNEVRAAAISRVQHLQERYGGRIPLSALSQGITLEGLRIPIWNYQKGIFKPGVLGRDGAALSLHTSFKSPYDDEHDIEAARIIYKYQGTDPLHHDNKAAVRAMERKLPLIYLVAVDPGVYEAIAPVYVIGAEPRRLQFTLLADSAILASDDWIATHIRREYETRTVLQRLHQREFRRIVLGAYRNQCAICRLRHVRLLDAAHILKDRHPRGVAAIPNGLGLCKIHHSAYDADIIGIDPDTRVHVRRDILEEKDGPMLEHGIQGVEGGKLILPRKEALRPNRDFLAERFEEFRAA